MSEEDINNLKEMLVDFNEYSTDYTKTRCKELEKTIENTLKEVERLNNNINKTIHRIQLIQMDGEVTIRDLTELVNILKGSDKE